MLIVTLSLKCWLLLIIICYVNTCLLSARFSESHTFESKEFFMNELKKHYKDVSVKFSDEML